MNKNQWFKTQSARVTIITSYVHFVVSIQQLKLITFSSGSIVYTIYAYTTYISKAVVLVLASTVAVSILAECSVSTMSWIIINTNTDDRV